jgi:competence protein ComEC
VRAVAGAAARAPLALAPTGGSPWVAGLAGAGALLLALALSGPRTLEPEPWRAAARRRGVRHLGALGLALAVALAVTWPPLAPPPGRFWVVVLDVGQGEAIALGLPGGWALVDAGPRTPRFDAGAGVVLPFLRWAAVRRLETLVLTHEHGDHVGGAAAVRRGLVVGGVVVPEGAAGPPRARRARQGDTLARRPPVVVRWPPAGFRSGDRNRASLVLEAGDGAGRAWLAADVDSAVEPALRPGPLALLKVAHHGAGSSTGAAFLARARPREAVISCGRRNPFGHPHPATLERLARSGARVHRTDRHGTVWFELGEDGARVVTWRSGRLAPAREARGPPAAGGCLAGGPARW